MQTVILAIFSLELALLFAHEMDAVRRQEWKMFIVLKEMEDEKAYRVFLSLHIPLYMAMIFLLLSPFSQIAFYVVDAFLLAHMLVHLGFRNHPANKLNGTISKAIINAAGVLAIIHLLAVSTR